MRHRHVTPTAASRRFGGLTGHYGPDTAYLIAIRLNWTIVRFLQFPPKKGSLPVFLGLIACGIRQKGRNFANRSDVLGFP